MVERNDADIQDSFRGGCSPTSERFQMGRKKPADSWLSKQETSVDTLPRPSENRGHTFRKFSRVRDRIVRRRSQIEAFRLRQRRGGV